MSTEDTQIASVAKQWGAEVPFLRPVCLAQDTTPGIDPIIHAVEWFAKHEDFRPDLVLCLQPTSPLRSQTDLHQAIVLQQTSGADSVVSVSSVRDHPYWCKTIDQAGRLHDLITQSVKINRRQDLPPIYALNGAIYLIQRSVLLEQRSFYTANTVALVMPNERSLDIDSEWDLHLADWLLADQNTQPKRCQHALG